MIDRRTFIAGLGAAATSAYRRAHAQQPVRCRAHRLLTLVTAP